MGSRKIVCKSQSLNRSLRTSRPAMLLKQDIVRPEQWPLCRQASKLSSDAEENSTGLLEVLTVKSSRSGLHLLFGSKWWLVMIQSYFFPRCGPSAQGIAIVDVRFYLVQIEIHQEPNAWFPEQFPHQKTFVSVTFPYLHASNQLLHASVYYPFICTNQEPSCATAGS